MGTPEVEALKSALVHNSNLVEWCTVGVFAGLIVEYTILLWFKRGELSRFEMTLTILAGLAIAGGVYGEYFFGSKVTASALRLQTISDTEVARLTKEAEEAKLARVKLEKISTLRVFTPDQLDSFSKQLSSFAGQRGYVATFPVNFEAQVFAGYIEALLSKAKWNINVTTDHPASLMVQGIYIQATPDDDSQRAGAALFELFKANDIAGVWTPGSVKGFPPLKSLSGKYVYVMVGDHPLPPAPK